MLNIRYTHTDEGTKVNQELTLVGSVKIDSAGGYLVYIGQCDSEGFYESELRLDWFPDGAHFEVETI